MEWYDSNYKELVQAMGICECKTENRDKSAHFLISGDEEVVDRLLDKLNEMKMNENNLKVKYKENKGELWVYFPLTQKERPNKKSRAYKEYISQVIVDVLEDILEKWDQIREEIRNRE